MKRLLCTFGVLALFFLTACNASNNNSYDLTGNQDISVEDIENKEKLDGMPNPVKNVADDVDFEEVTGFSLDCEKIPGDIGYKSIISDDICSVQFVYHANDGDLNCVFRGRIMDSYIENMQGIYDEITSQNHFGYGLGEEIVDVLEIEYNMGCVVYEFLVDDNSKGITKQCSLELDRKISDDELSSLLENVLWAMNAF